MAMDPKPVNVYRIPEGVVFDFDGWRRTVITYDQEEIKQLLDRARNAKQMPVDTRPRTH